MISPNFFVKRCVFLPALAASLIFGHAWAQNNAAPADTQKRIGQAGAYVEKALEDVTRLLPPKTVGDIHPKSISLELAINFLRSHTSELRAGTGTVDVGADLDSIKLASQKLSSAADNGDAVGAETQVTEIKRLWDEVKAKVPAGVFAAKLDPPVYGCIMHSAQTRAGPGTCPICGMVMIPKQAFQVALTEPITTVTAQIEGAAPLEVGKEFKGTLRLRTVEGKPLGVNELMVIHTQPIHLLIVDQSLSDYHHEHPVPTANLGEFTFAFTPTKPGPYRIFADIVPSVTGRQEYARADIPSAQAGEPIGDKKTILQSQVGDLTYTLTFEREHLIRGEPLTGKLHIERTADHAPFTKLEPVMGVFAHFVGFHEDHESIIHIHPQGPDPVPPASRGGPELEIIFIPLKSGFVRLYAQVQIDGVSKFAPFNLNFEEPPPVAVKGDSTVPARASGL